MRTTRTDLGENFSEGARLSWLALRARGWSVADLRARMVGPRSGEPMAGGVLDPVLYGDRLPSFALAGQLAAALGVPVEAWARKPARRFVLEASKRHDAKVRGLTGSRKRGQLRSKTTSDGVRRSEGRA